MHPTRSHLSIQGDVQNTRRSSPPLNILPSGSASTQMSLPSIRHLHPYLPPTASGMSAPLGMADSAATMPYHAHPSDPYSQGQPHPMASHYTTRSRESNPPYPLPESEVDELEQQGPPKKKRRRQALSCTECKRRKIKCDRSQPCAPCTRRGEQAKCHWHVVEPVGKDVTRQEFDELKSRLEVLETWVQNLLPDSSPRPLSRHRLPPGVPGAIAAEAAPSFHPGYSGHHPLPQSRTQTYNGGSSSSPQTQRHPTRTDSPHLRSPIGSTLPNPSAPHRSGSPMLSAPKHRTADSPAVAGGSSTFNIPSSNRPLSRSSSPPKGTSFSIAAITTPYEPQSKNYCAQTLKPGERLRTTYGNLKGLATILLWTVIHASLHPLPLCHITVVR